MAFRLTDEYLERLNKKVVFVTFEDATWFNDLAQSVEAEYFGRRIKIWLPNCKKKTLVNSEELDKFCVEVFDPESEHEERDCLPDATGDVYLTRLAQVIRVVNEYLKSRPFSIVRYDWGTYKLFDPDGRDFTGKYMSLSEAKKRCDHNFIMGRKNL